MKKESLLILISGLLLSTALNSQTYNLTVRNEPFEFLSGGQAATVGVWDDPTFTLPLGFSFDFFENTYTQLYSAEYTGGIFSFNTNFNDLFLVMPFNVDLIDRGYYQDDPMSPIKYKTEGPVGDRIFSIEYSNAGFFSGAVDPDSLFIDYVNLQMRLFEKTGDIEYHFGPHSVSEPELDFFGYPGPIVGLIAGTDIFGQNFDELMLLSGDPLDPDVVTFTLETYLTWPIPENTVYHFSTGTTSTNDGPTLAKDQFLFPNPTTGAIHIKDDRLDEIVFPIRVFDSQGKVTAQWFNPGEMQLENYPAGLYNVIIQTIKGTITEKVLLLPN